MYYTLCVSGAVNIENFARKYLCSVSKFPFYIIRYKIIMPCHFCTHQQLSKDWLLDRFD